MGDRVEQLGGEVPKDSHAREHHSDREQLGAEATRCRVETGQRGGDDRPVERRVPCLVEQVHETERPAREEDGHGNDEQDDLAGCEAVPLHGL